PRSPALGQVIFACFDQSMLTRYERELAGKA
ncbi:MAG: O-acetyl-ADP-ribose deacetylase, partial [Paraburkholderia sp.]|nr:O-acetyl-ADP-ribose deacetylase [Paraburkholderia sp.]